MIQIEIIAETIEARNAKAIEIADAVSATIAKRTAPRSAGIDGAIEYLRTQGFVIAAFE